MSNTNDMYSTTINKLNNRSKFVLTIFALVFSFAASAQCYDDDCIDDMANTTPVPGCCEGTTIGMTSSYSGTYGCATLTGGIDTWVTFMAPSNGFLTIDFTSILTGPTGVPIAGTVDIVVFDSFSNSDNCATLAAGGVIAAIECFDAAAPPNPMQLNAVQVGERYFILISTPPGQTPGDFEICLDVTIPTGGMDCPDATPLCTTDPIQLDAIGSGPGAISGGSSMEDISTDPNGPNDGIAGSCWGDGVYGGGEVNSQWYTFTAANNGTIEMAIVPQDIVVNCATGSVTSADYDWMLLDVSTTLAENSDLYTCNINGSDFGGQDSATVVACDWSGQYGITGFSATGPSDFGLEGTTQNGCQSTDGYAGSSTTAWNAGAVNLTAGNTYALVISNYTGTTAGFDLQWGGTAEFGVQPVVLNTLTLSACDITTTILAPLEGGNLIWSYDYQIDWGDGTTTTAANPSLSHSYSAGGTYTVTILVTDPVGCVQGYSETIVSPCPLPVELVDFSGENVGEENLLYWYTATEKNSDYFYIEKSTNMSNWTRIDSVKAAGTTSMPHNYSTVDRTPGKVTYYKLNQVDLDGNIHHFPVISISRNGNSPDIFSGASPNPASGAIQFSYLGKDFDSEIYVQIVSTDGRVCLTKSVYPNSNGLNYTIDISSLDTGNYQLVLTQDDKREVKNIVIQ